MNSSSSWPINDLIGVIYTHSSVVLAIITCQNPKLLTLICSEISDTVIEDGQNCSFRSSLCFTSLYLSLYMLPFSCASGNIVDLSFDL